MRKRALARVAAERAAWTGTCYDCRDTGIAGGSLNTPCTLCARGHAIAAERQMASARAIFAEGNIPARYANFTLDTFPSQEIEAFDKLTDFLAEWDWQRGLILKGEYGVGKCVGADEPIRLADGSLVEAKRLVNTRQDVLSVADTLEVSKQAAYFTDNGIQEVVELVTERGRVLRRTIEHPLWADPAPMYRRNILRAGVRSTGISTHGQWVPAGQLDVGAAVAVYAGHQWPAQPYDLLNPVQRAKSGSHTQRLSRE